LAASDRVSAVHKLALVKRDDATSMCAKISELIQSTTIEEEIDRRERHDPTRTLQYVDNGLVIVN
jgi:hypothetical protein